METQSVGPRCGRAEDSLLTDRIRLKSHSINYLKKLTKRRVFVPLSEFSPQTKSMHHFIPASSLELFGFLESKRLFNLDSMTPLKASGPIMSRAHLKK